jgi:hypothetical protein
VETVRQQHVETALIEHPAPAEQPWKPIVGSMGPRGSRRWTRPWPSS